MTAKPFVVRVELRTLAARPGAEGIADRSAAVRAVAKIELAAVLGIAPADVAIGAEPGGRPTVMGAALSLAHSGDLVAVAIAPAGCRIGVDVEAVRPRRHLERMARRVFDATELAQWKAVDDAERLQSFLQRWTEVEAVLKARGTGVAGGFASAIPTPLGWSCLPIDAGAGFAGAVAADTSWITVRVGRGHYKS